MRSHVERGNEAQSVGTRRVAAVRQVKGVLEFRSPARQAGPTSAPSAAAANRCGTRRGGRSAGRCGRRSSRAGLEQVGRQPGAAITVVIGQGRGEGRRGNAQPHGGGDHVSPGVLGLGRGLPEVRRQEQVLQLGIGVEGLLDPFQKHRADDAAAAPQQGDRSEGQRPLVLGGRGLHLHVALRIAHDLRCVQGLADLLDERLAVALVLARGTGQPSTARARASRRAERQRA